MRYVLFVRMGRWQKVAEFNAKDALDAMVQAAKSLLPKQHDLPILLQPADEPPPRPDASG